MEYVGREVKKKSQDSGPFIGTVNSYDQVRCLFEILYENGVSEEMDLTQMSSLIGEGSNEDLGFGIERNDGEKGLNCGGAEVTRKRGRPRKKRRVGVGKKQLNCDLDLNEEVRVVDDQNGKLDLDLNRNDEGSGGELSLGLDLNRIGEDDNRWNMGLDLNRIGEDGNQGLEVEGCLDRGGIIDLNVDVNEGGGAGEVEVANVEGDNVGVKRKDRGFDLNLGLEDEVRGLDVESPVLVKDGDETVGAEVNCKSQGLSSAVCSVYVEQPEKKLGGSESMDGELRGVSVDGDDTNGPENVGGESRGKRGRKRKKMGVDTPSVTETVLRRSSRRTRVEPLLEQVPALSNLDVGDDSSAISGVSEEKVIGPSPEETVEHLILPPKVELPPSSERLNLEGMSGIDVFSVYSFLRSFSMLLFLSPFKLEDFVASVRCNVPNLLFDSIHVSLLHILRKNMVSLADESLQTTCDCLRLLNWDLLDLITWPVFLVEYLLMHSHSIPEGLDLHHLKLSGTDYHSQPVYNKIEVLKCLCDEVTAAEVIRSELNRRTQGTELSPDSDRKTKINHSKKRTALNGVRRSCLTEEESDERADCNSDECCLCKLDGRLICCDGCPAAFHARCVGVTSNLLPEGDWYCPECSIDKNNSWLKVGKSIRGAKLLGTDSYGRLFYGSCGYLLVSEFSDDSSSLKYYHRNDLLSVFEALKSSTVNNHHILDSVSKFWLLSAPVDVLKKVAKPTKSEIDNVNNFPKMETKMTNSANVDCALKLSEITQDPGTPEKFPEIGEHPLTSATSENEQGKNASFPPHSHSLSRTIAGCGMLKGASLSSYANHYSFAQTSSSIVEHLAQKEPDHNPENAKRSAEDFISKQLTAISSTFSDFCWLNIYNQNADAKKETCGWCYFCQFPEYERDCFFINKDKHFARENYTSEALGVRPSKNIKSHLVSVMCHMLYMEDHLQGLLLGPWLNPDYTKLWRQNVLKASDVDSLKKLLLKLESNIRHLAVSADWLKPVDSSLAVGSARFVSNSSQQAPSKQGNGRKKARYMDLETNSSSKTGPFLFWWRGGNISRELFNHKALPHYLARKAARQAGGKKIPDILYPENSEVARRNKSIAWRAALEALSSVQQLALQVRELDSNIKWNEIGSTSVVSLFEKESKKPNRSSFKKVIIRRKCSKGIMPKYLLDFGKRRFIPDIVLKHGTLFEESSSEKKRYWLEETYVPLHLLKLFEEKRIARKPSNVGSGEVQNSRTLKKPFKRKGFSYLFSKAEKPENYQCGHCKKDVLIREAVSCQYCKGFFHKRHVKRSPGAITKCTYTCYNCREGPSKKVNSRKGRPLSQKSTEAVKVNLIPKKIRKQNGRGRPPIKLQGKRKQNGRGRPPIKLQGKRKHQVVLPLRRSPRKTKTVLPQKPKRKVKKKGKWKNSNKDSAKKAVKEIIQKKRTKMHYCYWLNGLRLSRKLNDEHVIDFRTNNLISITEELASTVDQPKCGLCCEHEITPMLNYIACEICGDWFHGDAFNLTAERATMLIGFKCHKCRSMDSPACPHLHAKRTDRVVYGEPLTTADEGTDRKSSNQVLLKEGTEECDPPLKEESAAIAPGGSGDSLTN